VREPKYSNESLRKIVTMEQNESDCGREPTMPNEPLIARETISAERVMLRERTTPAERVIPSERTITGERAVSSERTTYLERPIWLERYLNQQAMGRRPRRLLQLQHAVSQIKHYATNKDV
jgi:hypothetical protein